MSTHSTKSTVSTSYFELPLKVLFAVTLTAGLFLFFSCSPTQSVSLPKIDRHPSPFQKKLEPLQGFPEQEGVVDVRGKDLSRTPITDASRLLFTKFDTNTQWPSNMSSKIFDPKRIMQLGKDPGLGVRQLHDRGVTGKNVSVAIIDQPLLVEHDEYKDSLVWYEEIGIAPDMPAQYHGPAVASLLAGKTTGVAPDARLFYFAAWLHRGNDWEQCPTQPDEEMIFFDSYIQAIDHIIDLNKQLPANQQIRVISISRGYSTDDPCVAKASAFADAIHRAQQSGLFVVTAALKKDYPGYGLMGLNRAPLDDPNDTNSYRPGSLWSDRFFSHPNDYSSTFQVPMDSRSFAASTGDHDYVWGREGGLSWSVPWFAGLYALAVQVNPKITPDQFLKASLETSTPVPCQQDGQTYTLQHVVNPLGLIQKIQDHK